MTLAEMRHRGAIIELKDGGINVRRTTDAITAALTQNKAAIIATLKRERLDGIDYHDSKVYWSLNVLYDNWHRLPNSEERDNALLLLRRWDNVLTDNFRDGARMVAEEQPMLELIAESVPLAGVTLHRAVSEIVGGMSRAPKPSRTVSVTALDGPVTVAAPTPTAEPRQFGLLDPVEPVPAHVTAPVTTTTERRATYAGLG